MTWTNSPYAYEERFLITVLGVSTDCKIKTSWLDYTFNLSTQN